MRRWVLWIVLLLSLGVNVGILLTLALDRGGGGGTEETVEIPRDLTRELGTEAAGERPGFEPPGPRGGGPMRVLERLADRLELTGEPRERFLDLQRSFLRTGFEGRRQRWRLERELRRELTAPEPDRQRVEALVDELAATFRDMERNLASTVLETRDLLGPEQERLYLGFLQRLRRHLDDEVRRRARGPRPPRSRQGPPPVPGGGEGR